MVQAFEGNKAETRTMLPVITAFMAAHGFEQMISRNTRPPGQFCVRPGAANKRSGAARIACRPAETCRQIGGSARGYQAIFVPSTTLASPGHDGQPTVYLYIAALEVNILNCRI